MHAPHILAKDKDTIFVSVMWWYSRHHDGRQRLQIHPALVNPLQRCRKNLHGPAILRSRPSSICIYMPCIRSGFLNSPTNLAFAFVTFTKCLKVTCVCSTEANAWTTDERLVHITTTSDSWLAIRYWSILYSNSLRYVGDCLNPDRGAPIDVFFPFRASEVHRAIMARSCKQGNVRLSQLARTRLFSPTTFTAVAIQE
jgi:hypothetical protein